MQTLVNPLVKAANGFDDSAGVISKTDSYLRFVLIGKLKGFDLGEDRNLNQVITGAPPPNNSSAEIRWNVSEIYRIRTKSAVVLMSVVPEILNIPTNLPTILRSDALVSQWLLMA